MLGNLIEAFIPRQRAATIQQLGHPAAGIIGWYSADDNTSGEIVTEETALKISAFWCGVRVISETLASLPCILYERVGDNDKRRAVEDNRYALVHDAPNDELDAYHFFEVSTAHQVIWGNSYAKIERDGINEPQSIELRLPDRTEPKRREDGVLEYRCSDPRETTEFQDMLHGVGFSFDGIKGYSLIRTASQSLGASIAGEKFSGASMKNGNTPSGVLDVPVKMGKPAREELRREWDEIHGGASKAGRLAITHGGMKYVPISMNNRDAQLIESRKFSVVEIARWLRLPLYILADLENSGVRANIEQQAIDLISYSLMPWVKRWEGALRMKLLRRDERSRLFFEFLLDSLLRGDTLTRYQAHALGRQWGWSSVNDIRRMENQNTIGPEGDVYLEPLNMKPAGSESPQATKAAIPGTIVSEYKKNLARTINETMDVAKQMRSALESGFSGVQESFREFGGVLEHAVSSERETFRLIKEDIATLGAKISIPVPELPISNVNLLSEAIRVLLRMESTEAIKAAKAQSRDKSQNFIARMDKFYSVHIDKVRRSFAAHGIEACTENHIETSQADLLECCDGDPVDFEARIKECVDQWLADRVTKEAETYHAKVS